MFGGFSIPLSGHRVILWDASASLIAIAKVELRRRVPLFGGFPKPLDGLRIILCYALAVAITTA